MLLILSLICILTVSSMLLLFSRKRTHLETMLLLLVYTCAQIFISVLFCGVLGLLTTAGLFLFHILLLLSTTLYYYIKFLKKHNKKWALLFIDIGRLWRDLARACRAIARRDFVKMAFFLLLLALCYVSFLNVILPVHDWDGFMYHLFLPANWLQQGNLDIFTAAPQLRLDKWVHFPANLEMFSAWYMGLAGNDTYVEFFQFPIILAGLLALFGIARIFGVCNRYAVWAMPLFVTVPIIFCQLNSSYVDGAVASLFFIGFYCFVRGFVARSLLLFGGGVVSAALLLGSKSSGPLFFAVLLTFSAAGALVLSIERGRFLSMLRRLVLHFALATFVATLFGGYFFIRNYAVAGNPFYPYELRLMGKQVFKGIDPVKQTTFGRQKNRFDFLKKRYTDQYRQFVYNYYGHNFAGHGPAPLVFGLPAMLLVPFFFLQRKRWREAVLFLLLGLSVVAVVVAMPSLFPRFTLLLDGFAIISAVMVLSVLFWGGRVVLQLLFCASIVYCLIVSAPMNHHMKRHIKNALKSKRVLSAADSPYSGREFKRIDRLFRNRKVKMAYSGLMMPYPLFGRTLSRKVIHIKADNYKSWRTSLQGLGVHFLVLGKPGFVYREQIWAASQPRLFRRVLVNNKLDMYLVVSKENVRLYREMLRNANK